MGFKLIKKENFDNNDEKVSFNYFCRICNHNNFIQY